MENQFPRTVIQMERVFSQEAVAIPGFVYLTPKELESLEEPLPSDYSVEDPTVTIAVGEETSEHLLYALVVFKTRVYNAIVEALLRDEQPVPETYKYVVKGASWFTENTDHINEPTYVSIHLRLQGKRVCHNGGSVFVRGGKLHISLNRQ